MSIEAMKLALDCLEDIFGTEKIDVGAINALRQAIAEAEKQEPVAMRYDFDGYGWLYIDNGSGSNWKEKIKNAEPLYAAPPQRTWVGLTVREIEWCFCDANDAQIVAARSIEAKLREKNGG